MAIEYAELAPPPALRPFVACYWAIEGQGDTDHRVLPDGCIDLLFDATGGSVVGAMTRAIVARPGGRASLLGVRFRPGAAATFLRVAAGELTDERVPLAELWGREGAALERRLEPGTPVANRVRALEAALIRRAAAVEPRLDPHVATAVAAIERSRGGLRVEDLCERLGVTRQHLARRFRDEVGLSPKTFARVARLQAAVALAERAPALGLAALACDAGYCDQAHLCREFADLAGAPPGDVLEVPNVQDALAPRG